MNGLWTVLIKNKTINGCDATDMIIGRRLTRDCRIETLLLSLISNKTN